MPEDLKYKWLELDNHVTDLLIELWPQTFNGYRMDNGKMIVKMNKHSYEWKESANY